MTRILGIDPGTTRSAWLLLVDGQPGLFAKEPNEDIADLLRRGGIPADVVVIEEITSYGTRPVGRETFQTMAWAGRFAEAMHRTPCVWLPRGTIARRLGARGDSGIRAALIDRFGGESAIGRKATPGPLFGIAADVWSALAVAVAHQLEIEEATR